MTRLLLMATLTLLWGLAAGCSGSLRPRSSSGDKVVAPTPGAADVGTNTRGGSRSDESGAPDVGLTGKIGTEF